MMTRRLPDGSRTPDEVIVEEPLEIRLDGQLVATTMRTPGHDYELAVGFCHGDGLLADARVTEVRYCATGSAIETEFNVVSVDTGGSAPQPRARVGTVTSSCGICGRDAIDELTSRLTPLAGTDLLDPALAVLIGDRVARQQELFERTGGVHAAAAFDLVSGEPTVVREDIGRHNAVDKVVGRLLLDHRLPTADRPAGLWVSGRASFEMVQKAWAGGFRALVSVSAPSALAVETAMAANMALLGFVRDARAVRYS